jgi:chromosome segregation ATPase
MDKGALGIAGLVAGILGVVVGGLAYMQAGKALGNANEAFAVAEDQAKNAAGPAEIRKAVREEIAATKADLEKMVTEVRAEVRKLEEQAQRADVLLEAKGHADANAERSSKDLMTQVRALKEELASGDQETKAHYDQLKADLEEKIEKSHEAIRRMVTRWMESGAM